MAPKSTRVTKAAAIKANLSSKAAEADVENALHELDNALLETMEKQDTGASGSVEVTKDALQLALATNLKGSNIGAKQTPEDEQETSVFSKTDTTLLDQNQDEPDIESSKVLSHSDGEDSKTEEEEEGEKYTVPEGLPGTGTIVTSWKASDLDVIKNNIGLIKIKRIGELIKLGDRVVKTPCGNRVLSPYSQLMIRTASIYYNDIKKVGFSADAIRAIHYATVTDDMRLKMIEENRSRPLKEFLEREELRYFAFVLQGLLIEEEHFNAVDIFSVISEGEMKSRLTSLETSYKDAYHIYSIISEIVDKGVNVAMPVPPFLKASSALLSYVDAVAVGKKMAEEITFNVPKRIRSNIPTSDVQVPSKKSEKRVRMEKASSAEEPISKKSRSTIASGSAPTIQDSVPVRDTTNFEDFTELISHFEKKLEDVIDQQKKEAKIAADHRESVNKKLVDMSRSIRSLVVEKSEAALAGTVNVNKTFKAAGLGTQSKINKQEGKKPVAGEGGEDETNYSEAAKALIREISIFQPGDQDELAERANQFLKEQGEMQFKVSAALLLVSSYRKRLMTIIKSHENRG